MPIAPSWVTGVTGNHHLAKEKPKVGLFRPSNNSFFSLTALGRFACTAAVLLGGVLASHQLFLQLLSNVLRSPMLFFEQTPIGHLLNRFSRDMDAVDSVIPDKLKSVLGFLFNLLEIYLVIVVATPWAAVAIVALTVLYAAFQVGAHRYTHWRGWSSTSLALQKASFHFLGGKACRISFIISSCIWARVKSVPFPHHHSLPKHPRALTKRFILFWCLKQILPRLYPSYPLVWITWRAKAFFLFYRIPTLLFNVSMFASQDWALGRGRCISVLHGTKGSAAGETECRDFVGSQQPGSFAPTKLRTLGIVRIIPNKGRTT